MGIFSSQITEGPGISKNVREKRGFINFFELFFRNYGKLLGAGLKTFFLSLIIIPTGLGEIGSAKICRCCARNTHAFASDYRDAIKQNFRQALITGIINSLLTAVSGVTVYFLYNESDSLRRTVMLGFALFAFVVITFMRYYTPAILLSFNVSLSQLYKDSLLLAFAGIVRNLMIVAVMLFAYAVVLSPLLIDIYVGTGLAICAFFLIIVPLRQYAIQYHIFPVLYKYLLYPFMKEHPGEGENTLRDYGLWETDVKSEFTDTVE